MPLLPLNDTSCFYRVDGKDAAPVVVFAHSLGLDHGQWDAQTADLQRHFRVVRYDIRGHGASGVTFGGLFDRAPESRRARAAGRPALAAGGMVRVVARRHDRAMDGRERTRAPDPSRPGEHLIASDGSFSMETRRMAVNQGGMAAVEPLVMSRFFSPEVLAAMRPEVAWARRTLLATNPVGYANCCAAIRDMDLTPLVNRIKVPTLVLSGDRDVSMPWPEHGEKLAQGIAGARAVRLDTAHISNLEKPRSFTSALFDFLLPTSADTLDRGFAVRRSVLGDAHVDGAVAATTELTREFQELITRFAWGAVWSRPGLDHRTRRLLVLATTASLGRWEEFRLHVRTGLAHELETSGSERSAPPDGALCRHPCRQHGVCDSERGDRANRK